MGESCQTVLFSSWRSSCSYRVRICLNFKKIPHEIKQINLIKLAELGDKSYDSNPMSYIPALLIDGHTLIESMAILEYLEETRSEIPLLPSDSLKRAQVRAICGIIISGIQPLQNIGVLNQMGHYLGEKEKAWSQHWIVKGFNAIEKLLKFSAGKYCVGDEITFADCCLVPQVYNARRCAKIMKISIQSPNSSKFDIGFLLTLNFFQPYGALILIYINTLRSDWHIQFCKLTFLRKS